MKTVRIFAAALLLFALASCQKTEESVTSVNVGPHTVNIKASFSEDTKTLVSQDGEGHFKGLWEAGDVIYVYEWVTGVSSDPSLYDIESGSGFVASDPLTAGGETADFTATFDPYYWESTLTAEELATYTFTYSYFACSFNPFYLHSDGEGKDYLSLLIDRNQTVYSDGYSTAGDMLVSRKSEYAGPSRPADISFNFARLGTIVKMTVSGLQEGDKLKSGTFYTGDNMLAAVTLEDIVSYYPDEGKYRYEVSDYMEDSGMLGECRQINFACTDDTRPILADANGEAVLYLRVLPGVCNDWFAMTCTVERGEEEFKYAKRVSLTALGRSLEFKDGGLTKFSVGLKPAQASSPEYIMYMVPKPRNGFMAAWEADAHASGYECYYQRQEGYDYELDEDMIYDKVPLTPVEGTGEMEGMYYVEVESGLAPDIYDLYVRAIPDSESELDDFYFSEKRLYVGVTRTFQWPDVDSYSSQFVLENLGEGLHKVYEKGDILEPWYFTSSNLRTNWGQLYSYDGSSEWTLSTHTGPTFQHDGEISGIMIKMSKNKENTTKVYGISRDGTATLIAQPEDQYWSESEKYYEYDLSGGSYNGFKIESGGYLYVNMLRVFFYPPTGD